jgi:hypothetical protein
VVFPMLLVVPGVLSIGALTAILYACFPLYNVVQLSYRLALIPDHLQGRVNSAFRLVAVGSQPLGAALAGVLLEKVGVTPTFIVFGVALVALAIVASTSAHIRHARPVVALPAAAG